jgi:uncharacterized protein DUF5658
MSARRERALVVLVLLNLVLQVFDGVATYLGLAAGHLEGNPIVAALLASLGTAPALVAVKLFACGCLLLIWQLRDRSRLALPALAAAALAYTVGSAAPWSAALAF